jgi:hypothetical protein
LGQAQKEIFLQTGLDSPMAAEPVGQITLPELIRINLIRQI